MENSSGCCKTILEIQMATKQNFIDGTHSIVFEQ